MRIASIFFLILTLWSSAVFAEPEVHTETEYSSGLLPTLTAVVPGVAFHGLGHIVAGETKTGWRLFAAQWAGAGLMFAGLATLAVTGAAPEFNPPAIWMLSGGGGLFFFSWFADIYGSSGAEKIAGRAPNFLPALSVSQGLMFVSNPILDPSAFSKTQVAGFPGRWRLQLDAFFHLGGLSGEATEDIRFDGTAAYRITGVSNSKKTVDSGKSSAFRNGSYFDLVFGYRHHQYDQRRVAENTFSFELKTRFDLRHIGPSLRGAFVDGSLGLAAGSYSYDNIGSEFAEVLLTSIGFGVYLSKADGEWGTARLFYDHRHDGYIGGSKVPGLGSGALGSINARVDRHIWNGWGFDAGFGLGSGYVGDFSVVYRWND